MSDEFVNITLRVPKIHETFYRELVAGAEPPGQSPEDMCIVVAVHARGRLRDRQRCWKYQTYPADPNRRETAAETGLACARMLGAASGILKYEFGNLLDAFPDASPEKLKSSWLIGFDSIGPPDSSGETAAEAKSQLPPRAFHQEES